jgi:hypothetical protein
MGSKMRISSLSPEEVRARIGASNRASHEGQARYIDRENLAIHSDYDFIDCPCAPECWCRHRGCLGHYLIREMLFNQFLGTYVALWVPKRARENIRAGVLEGKPFGGRQRNAIPALQWLAQNWDGCLAKARSARKCGLCDPTISIGRRVANLYEAKMWSQLFYDALVPFDTASIGEIRRAGYVTNDFLDMNRQLFRDLRAFGEAHSLNVAAIRGLDTPWDVSRDLRRPPGGQPLSRVIDKIFYNPGRRPLSH